MTDENERRAEEGYEDPGARGEPDPGGEARPDPGDKRAVDPGAAPQPHEIGHGGFPDPGTGAPETPPSPPPMNQPAWGAPQAPQGGSTAPNVADWGDPWRAGADPSGDPWIPPAASGSSQENPWGPGPAGTGAHHWGSAGAWGQGDRWHPADPQAGPQPGQPHGQPGWHGGHPATAASESPGNTWQGGHPDPGQADPWRTGWQGAGTGNPWQYPAAPQAGGAPWHVGPPPPPGSAGSPAPYGGYPGRDDAIGMPVRRSRGPRTGVLLALVLVVGLLAGGLGSGVTLWVQGQRAPGASGDPVVSLEDVPKGSKQRPEGSVSAVARQLLPSVVSIKVKGADQVGTGSGFIIEGGYILTNNHVVQGAKDSEGIRVTFHDGQTTSATVVGTDAASDVAVIEPKGVSNLEPARLGNSSNVVVGDTVVAIGSPLGLAGTVTSGIVSAIDRPVIAGGSKGGDAAYINALQTDAPINPGNSGGPLVNMRGRVVGINSAIATIPSPLGSGSGNIGVGFAIPINQARRVAEQLINKGHATHPVIGAVVKLRFQGSGAKIATETQDGGPVILPDGPADRAGLRPGDVIVSFDGQSIHSAKELIVAIRSHVPGDEVKLTYRRGSTERTATLTLQASQK